MNHTASTSDKRSFVSIRSWLATLIKRAPRFELMPDEKLLYQGFVIQIFETYYGFTGKVRDGYLTSHRMVVCRKFFEQPEPGLGVGSLGGYVAFYMISLPFMYRKSKKILFEFPLADVLKFEMMNETGRPWYEIDTQGRHWYMFELKDGQKYVLDFRFLAGGIKLPWAPEDRWVAAIKAALQSVQKD